MLLVFGGLPGTGKTTLARRVADRLGATYLRIDAIEQALRSSIGLGDDVGPAGYEIACAISETNLGLGRAVVADCVNPLPVTRDAWREVAKRSGCLIFEIELVCSDQAEHQRRVESRESDIPGLNLPTWAAVMARHYEPWSEPRILVDTAHMTAAEAEDAIVEAIERGSSGSLHLG